MSFTVRKFLLRFNQVPTTSASSKVLRLLHHRLLQHGSCYSSQLPDLVCLPASPNRSIHLDSLTSFWGTHHFYMLTILRRFYHAFYFFWAWVLQFPLLYPYKLVNVAVQISGICSQISVLFLLQTHPSLRYQAYIFLPYLTSKVPSSSVPSIKMSDFITHMIKIKASVSFCILSHVVPHLVGPGRDTALPEQN